MKPAERSNAEIRAVLPHEQSEALKLVFSLLEPDQRRSQVETAELAIKSDETASAGLLGAYRGGRLVGAVFSQVQPGRTAVVWLPRLRKGEPPGTADRLLATTAERLDAQGVCIAQALVPKTSHSDDETLRKGGYNHLADLFYLACLENEFPTQPPKGSLQYESYDSGSHQRLARIVEATYCQTRDCPQLNGVRHIGDVLAGYRATGVFDPGRWLIVRHEGVDVGCLLLADHPENDNWELVYMGVAAPYRGRGWGREIARHAQWLTRQAGRPRLVLAVDAANNPALMVYAAVGFSAWDRRCVYLKVFQ